MNLEEMVFDDVGLREVPVRLAGKHYVLREANAAAARAFRNCWLKGTKLGPDGQPTEANSIADAELVLIHHCLFDRSGRPVPMNVIQNWSSRVTKALYERALEISEGLRQKETQEVLEARLKDTEEKLNALRVARANGNGQEASPEEDPTANLPASTTPG